MALQELELLNDSSPYTLSKFSLFFPLLKRERKTGAHLEKREKKDSVFFLFLRRGQVIIQGGERARRVLDVSVSFSLLRGGGGQKK